MSKHSALKEKNIDTEKMNKGIITSKIIFQTINTIIKDRALSMKKYFVSGNHNKHDFFLYCNGSTDILYLFLKLKSIGNLELNSFCSEGSEVEGGLDTTTSTPKNMTTRIPRANTKEKGMKEFTNVYKSKISSAMRFNDKEIEVQHSLMNRNNEKASYFQLQQDQLL